jgi:Ca2+-transporting ATPase
LEGQALQNDKRWYQKSAEDVFDALESGTAGLSTGESRARRGRYGYNELKFKKVGLVSVVMALAGFMMFYYYGEPAISGSVVDKELLMQARTAAFTTVMLVHICYIFTARSITESAFNFSPFSNKWVLLGVAITLGLQFTIIYAPWEKYIGVNPLRTAPLPAEWWITMILVSLPMFFIIEFEKFLTKRFGKGRG